MTTTNPIDAPEGGVFPADVSDQVKVTQLGREIVTNLRSQGFDGYLVYPLILPDGPAYRIEFSNPKAVCDVLLRDQNTAHVFVYLGRGVFEWSGTVNVRK